jgi:hypothetical protein
MAHAAPAWLLLAKLSGEHMVKPPIIRHRTKRTEDSVRVTLPSCDHVRPQPVSPEPAALNLIGSLDAVIQTVQRPAQPLDVTVAKLRKVIGHDRGD